ncbi:hypothetical protein [Agrobacterium tumefaciens]|jgi:hypothetical protein|uniref:hypothetical protein n=1 Tax=Agrobacterium tumefaciens TaxID=358 RepID=UPI00046E6B31
MMASEPKDPQFNPRVSPEVVERFRDLVPYRSIGKYVEKLLLAYIADPSIIDDDGTPVSFKSKAADKPIVTESEHRDTLLKLAEKQDELDALQGRYDKLRTLFDEHDARLSDIIDGRGKQIADLKRILEIKEAFINEHMAQYLSVTRKAPL